MIPTIPATRTLRASRTRALGMATLLFAGFGAAARAAETPTVLAAVASATPQLKMPAGEPQKLVLQAATTTAGAAAGPATARGEGRVSVDHPVAFLFRPETSGMYSIGVSSPQNAARISIYLGDSSKAEAGSTPADGAIRWTSEIGAGETVKVVVYTAGAEIPFRVSANGGPGGL